jgi:hypothetical protein
MEFSNINETLAVGTHTIAIKGNLNADTMDVVKVTEVKMNANAADEAKKDFDVTKLVAKAFPVLSASTSSNDLILKIENPKNDDDNENIDILGFNINGRVVTATFDNKTIDFISGTDALASLNAGIKAKGVSLAPGDKTELRLQADKSSTVQVKAIVVKVDNEIYVIDDNYTNIGSWSSFKVTANGDKTTADGKDLKYLPNDDLYNNANSATVARYNVYTLAID